MGDVMKYLSIIFLSLVTISTSACTEQSRAKYYGGNLTINLECDTKLVMPTWKNDNLWILTRPMHEVEEAITYTFKEDSSWGMMEGSVYIKECKTQR